MRPVTPHPFHLSAPENRQGLGEDLWVFPTGQGVALLTGKRRQKAADLLNPTTPPTHKPNPLLARLGFVPRRLPWE